MKIQSIITLLIILIVMHSCNEPAFAENYISNEGEIHYTTVCTRPENAIVPVGLDIDAWLEDDHLPEELLNNEDLHFCEAENDYFTMGLDEEQDMPYRLAVTIESGYEEMPFCVQPGNHSIELMHCMNYCFHGLDKYGSPTCLGNKQYFLRGSKNFTVVEVARLKGPNTFVADRPDVETLMSYSPETEITGYLSLPVGNLGDTVDFKAEPYPAGAWPDKCPDWLIFGCEFEVDGDMATLAIDKPFWDTVTAICGISYIRVGLAVVGVDAIVPGKITKGTSGDFFDEYGAYPFVNEEETYHVVDVNSKEISIKAIPQPDVANASSREIASYSEKLLPDAWSFTCNGKSDSKSRLQTTTDISAGGKFTYEASCGSSTQKLTVFSSGASILTTHPNGDNNQTTTTHPNVIFVPVPEQEGKYAFDKELLVPIVLHPIHLSELETLPVSVIANDGYDHPISIPSDNEQGPATPPVYNYGELKVKYNGKIKLWHDMERRIPFREEETIPLDKDTILYAEGLVFNDESGCDSAQIKLEYNSLIFNCSDVMPIAVLDLRPSVLFKYLLINNDNDDMGDVSATKPKDHESDMMQSYVENEDDLKPIQFKCPLVSPSLFKNAPPFIELQTYQEENHPFELWSHPEKVNQIFFISHLFDLEELATESGKSKRFYSVYVEGCEPTGADGSEIIADWGVNGQSFCYYIPLITLNMRMGVDDGRHVISDEDDSINFDDFGSSKQGDFGSYRCVFWVNNDCDCTHWETDRLPSMGWHEDDFGTNVNCLDDTIGCRLLLTNGLYRLTDIWNYSINDLEDFNRLHIMLDSTFKEIAQNDADNFFVFKLSNAPINIFQASVPGLDYLKSISMANNQAKERRIVALTPTSEVILLNKYLKFNGSISPFLWEACESGTYDLELSVSTKPHDGKSGEFIGKRRVRLVLRNISEYYDSWDASSSNGITPQKHPFIDGKQQTDDFILFVHGFNVLNSEKIFWPGTMHKRLWWNGFRGRTGIFTWDCSLVNIKQDLKKLKFNLHIYDQSELKAWQSAPKLKDLLIQLTSLYGDKVCLIAHSQGNIMANEALRLLPESHAIHAYIASQGAISSSCFQHIDKPYFLEKEYREKEQGIMPWLVTPDIYAHFPGWNEIAPKNHPPYLYSIITNAKAQIMINYFNPDDWALTSAMETSWEDNNVMKPNTGYGYSGDKHYYNAFQQYKLNYFFKGHLAQSGTVLKFPAMSDNHRNAQLEDTHTIFSFVAQAWGRPIGVTDKTTCFNSHFNLKELNFDGDHYSHSKQFRSNIQTIGSYWKKVFDDCN